MYCTLVRKADVNTGILLKQLIINLGATFPFFVPNLLEDTASTVQVPSNQELASYDRRQT